MGRKNRRRDDEARPLGPSYASRVTQTHADGQWTVQRVSGAGAAKEYRCPGCNQVIAVGTPHVVAFPADDPRGVDDRRHWHTPCWDARQRRGRQG
jgi:hypothetical protein